MSDEVPGPEIELTFVEILGIRDRLADVCEESYPHEDMRLPLATAIRKLSENDQSLWRLWSAEGLVEPGWLETLQMATIFITVAASDDPDLELFFDDHEMKDVLEAIYATGEWDFLYGTKRHRSSS